MHSLPMAFNKAIHLLYAPTDFCNMGCHYCYLGELTEAPIDAGKVLSTLDFALGRLLGAGYLPFNLSFHGGEATTLPVPLLDALFERSVRHYAEHGEHIAALGFKLNPPHIKTNLLNLRKHYETFLKYGVSISGSVDLPLSLHEKYRRDKHGRSTLERIRESLRLLADYPHHKKISCVVTGEHLQRLDEFAADIRYLHDELGLDMSRFNVMFGFDSPLNRAKFGATPAGTAMLGGEEQVEFYEFVKQSFAGTALEQAFRTEWFKEFTPEFCCSALNCGNKFFLLQADGDVYSCPRGQSSPEYRYGNVFEDDIETIIGNGWKTIERNENRMVLDEDCLRCRYLHYCHAGCTFVRSETGLAKSYTCQLQQAIYRDDPERYPPLSAEVVERHAKRLLLRNNIVRLAETHPLRQAPMTPELFAPANRLAALIDTDPLLRELYSDSLFFLRVGGRRHVLRAAILKNEHDIEPFGPASEILLGVREDALGIGSQDEGLDNCLHIMLLRDTPVVYGDERRSKQEHIFDYSLYRNTLIASTVYEDGYRVLDISGLLRAHAAHYREGVANNLFFTTKALREYHYAKHRKNAFYHIQAINLPFQNIEFLWQEDLIP